MLFKRVNFIYLKKFIHVQDLTPCCWVKLLLELSRSAVDLLFVLHGSLTYCFKMEETNSEPLIWL